MPISFQVKTTRGYFVTRYEGVVSGEEHYEAFRDFFTSDRWVPDMNELAIASAVQSSSISIDSLRNLHVFKEEMYKKYNITQVKVAIYGPGDLAFGIARAYNMITEGSSEEVRAFRDIKKALRWLRSR